MGVRVCFVTPIEFKCNVFVMYLYTASGAYTHVVQIKLRSRSNGIMHEIYKEKLKGLSDSPLRQTS